VLPPSPDTFLPRQHAQTQAIMTLFRIFLFSLGSNSHQGTFPRIRRAGHIVGAREPDYVFPFFLRLFGTLGAMGCGNIVGSFDTLAVLSGCSGRFRSCCHLQTWDWASGQCTISLRRLTELMGFLRRTCLGCYMAQFGFMKVYDM
jgi:hypothetical protein